MILFQKDLLERDLFYGFKVSSDLVKYKSVLTNGWGTGAKGACGAAFGSVCILPVWSDLVLDVSALAVVGLEDKDLSLPFSFFEKSILKSMFIARLSSKESPCFSLFCIRISDEEAK